jgi:hypothetical protein
MKTGKRELVPHNGRRCDGRLACRHETPGFSQQNRFYERE